LRLADCNSDRPGPSSCLPGEKTSYQGGVSSTKAESTVAFTCSPRLGRGAPPAAAASTGVRMPCRGSPRPEGYEDDDGTGSRAHGPGEHRIGRRPRQPDTPALPTTAQRL